MPFCATHRVTVVDFYGFGATPYPGGTLVLDDYVESIAELIRHYEMKNLTVVGHSFGGRVAIKLARYYGYMVDRLVLIDSAGMKPRRCIKYYFKIYKHKILKKLKIRHKSGSDDYIALSDEMKGTFNNIVNEHLEQHLKYVITPTLIIWGKNDADTPMYMAKRLNRKLIDSTLITLEGAGHYSYLEKPQLVTSIIMSFI